jgi:hypothetical protein
MMNVLYLPLPDRGPNTARQKLQHRDNHSAGRTFWLQQNRAVIQGFPAIWDRHGPRHGGNAAY